MEKKKFETKEVGFSIGYPNSKEKKEIDVYDVNCGKIITPMDLLPKYVEGSDGIIYDFEPEKIFHSIQKETDLSGSEANIVTNDVLRRIISIGNGDIFPAPFIREIACTTLAEKGHRDARNKYTRLGMPLYDAKTIIEGKSFEYAMCWSLSQMVIQLMHLNGMSSKLSNVILALMKRLETVDIKDSMEIIRILNRALDLYKDRRPKRIREDGMMD